MTSIRYIYNFKLKPSRNCSDVKLDQPAQHYLKITTSNCTQIITPTIHSLNHKQMIEIKVLDIIQRVQIWDYQNIKIIGKLSLKGITKNFQVNHTFQSKNVEILIKMTEQKNHITQKSCLRSVLLQKPLIQTLSVITQNQSQSNNQLKKLYKFKVVDQSKGNNDLFHTY